MSRYIILAASILLAVNFSIAVSPDDPITIFHQGFLADETGEAVEDGAYIFTFRIYDDGTEGNMLWLEHQVLQVKAGVFTAHLGTETPLDLPFDARYWVGIAIDGGDELTPRLPLSAVPYAIHAISVKDGAVTGKSLAQDIDITTSGTIEAGSFIGDGSELKDVDAVTLGGIDVAALLLTSNIAVGSTTAFINSTTSPVVVEDLLNISAPTDGSVLIDIGFNCRSFTGTTGTRWNVTPRINEVNAGPFFSLWFAHGSSIVGDSMSQSFISNINAGNHTIGYQAHRATGNGSLDCDIRVSALFLAVPSGFNEIDSESSIVGQGSRQ